jgi:hypothetical protein
MTTVFNSLPAQDTAAQSDYAPVLEKVAPGIVDIIDAKRKYNEHWFDVLLGLLSFISGTDEQKSLLSVLAQRAAGGIAPPSINEVMGGAGVASGDKPDLQKIAVVLGIAASLYSFMR